MDRKEWARIIEQAMDRYYKVITRQELNAAYEPWTEAKDASISEHILEFAQQLADVGREQLG